MKTHTHTITYTIHISIEGKDGKLAEYYIDEFMKTLPVYIEGLMNESEKVKITLDKNK